MEEKGFGVVLCFAAVLTAGQLFSLKRLSVEGRKISVSDRLLFVAPVFLVLGCACMHVSVLDYEKKAGNYTSCLENGKDVTAVGTVFGISLTERGYSFELLQAKTVSYEDVGTYGDVGVYTDVGTYGDVGVYRDVGTYGDVGVYADVGTLLVYLDCSPDEALSVKEGQKIFVYGRGYSYREAENPGQFDAKRYYFSKKITGALNARRIDVIDSSYHRLNQALFLTKIQIQKSFSDYLGAGAGVVSSMLLGERAFLSEETEELYRRGGISHILAISGLHVSLFGAAVYGMLRKSILGRNGAIPVACLCVLAYGRFVNAGISTSRAIYMFLLMLLATVLGRTYDTLSAMSVSLIVFLAKSPGALFTAAFQLSYAAAYGASVFAGILGGNAEGRRTSFPNSRLNSAGVSGGGMAYGASVFAGVLGVNKQKRGEHGAEMQTEQGKKGVRIAEWLIGFSRAAWSGLSEALRFGFAITLITLPLVARHFFEVPLYGILLNPIVVPLLSVLLFCAMLSGCLGICFPAAGVFFSGTVKVVLWLYELLCRFVSELPFSVLLFGKPMLWQVALYYFLLCVGVFFWKRAQWRKRLLFLRTGEVGHLHFWRYYLLVLILPLCLLQVPQTGLTVTFLSVGQGDGIVIEGRETIFSERKVVLMDGGSSDVSNLGEKRLIPFLKSKGICRISCIFVSHTDEDHISGVKEVLMQMPEKKKNRVREAKESLFVEDIEDVETERLSGQMGKILTAQSGVIVVEILVLPELSEPDAGYLSLLELAREKGVKVLFFTAGDALEVGKNLQFFCLSPEKKGSYADKNSASMVLLASYREFDLLLSGDATKEAEERMLRRWNAMPELRGRAIELLKVAHHGSATSTSEEFLAALCPQAAVISCGRQNRYGHPHKETLERLENAGVTVFRTDVGGAVTVRVKGKKVWVEEYLE